MTVRLIPVVSFGNFQGKGMVMDHRECTFARFRLIICKTDREEGDLSDQRSSLCGCRSVFLLKDDPGVRDYAASGGAEKRIDIDRFDPLP